MCFHELLFLLSLPPRFLYQQHCLAKKFGDWQIRLNILQADAGAQAVQIFDSWASELQPQDFDVFSGPYIQKIIKSVRETHPDLSIILYISGSGGLLERMAECKPDVVSVDQRVDMEDAIRRIGPSFAVQVCEYEQQHDLFYPAVEKRKIKALLKFLGTPP